MKYLIGILAAVSILAGCSAVFDARITGRVIDKEDGEGIEGAYVYLYDDEAKRDKDLDIWEDEGKRPDENKPVGYFQEAQTDGDGEYLFGKFVWETSSPGFGKTADRRQIYLAVWAEKIIEQEEEENGNGEENGDGNDNGEERKEVFLVVDRELYIVSEVSNTLVDIEIDFSNNDSSD